jgi:hypothetical protein
VLVHEYVRRRSGEEPPAFALPADDELFVNFVAQQLDLPPIERQVLLEARTFAERGERLVEVLEFQLEALRAGSPSSLRPQ